MSVSIEKALVAPEQFALTAPIGTVFYVVTRRNNMLNSKRLTMKDADGNVWYRYENGRHHYAVSRIEIVGRIKKTIEGVVDTDEQYDEVYVVYNNDHRPSIFISDVHDSVFFQSLIDAEGYQSAMNNAE